MPKKPFADIDAGMRGMILLPSTVTPKDIGMDPRSALAPLRANPMPNVISGNIVGPGPCVSTATTIVPIGPLDAKYTYLWSQVSGTFMNISNPRAPTVVFSADLSEGASIGAVFSCRVFNDYGQEAASTTVSVTLQSEVAYVPMSISEDPDSHTVVFTDAAGDGFCSFSVSVSGGQPPYSYFWGGGENDGNAYNYINFHIDTPGAGGAIDFAPGCTVTDATSATIGGAPGPFTLVRPG